MKGVHDKVYNAWKAGKPPSPAIGTLGIKVRNVEEARSVLEMDVGEHLHNLSGTMHGGVMVDIADAAMGIAVASTLKSDEDMTTIELKMSFMRPHIRGRLVAEGTIAKRGRRIAFTEAVLTNAKKEVVAKCTGSWLIMPA
ncbi:MAG TPA: PaaI family thioesterase [Candidatus Bathyarchaeia archaeon]|jgi:uncharacterized protein (TIGR00369 family)|nr:PaaI family thioesterase [Candidatus Bathyarchaeia archaeon]